MRARASISVCIECATHLAMKYIFLFYNFTCTFTVAAVHTSTREIILPMQMLFPTTCFLQFRQVFLFAFDGRRDAQSNQLKCCAENIFAVPSTELPEKNQRNDLLMNLTLSTSLSTRHNPSSPRSQVPVGEM